jgi:hypothetical protein
MFEGRNELADGSIYQYGEENPPGCLLLRSGGQERQSDKV